MDNTFDSMFYKESTMIGGMDESGVSDIAGPLVSAVVILPQIDRHKDDLKIFEVNDSKVVPEKFRKQYAEIIWQTAVAIGIGEVQPFEIDSLTKQDACALAMARAVAACKTTSHGKSVKPKLLLIDGDIPAPVNIRQVNIRDLDRKSLCVASASIVAKVYRDGVMTKLHERYPYYDWINNKGFPCENQFRGIDQYGIQIGIHRTRYWPFKTNPAFMEDHIKWKKRRKSWRKKTVDVLAQDLGKDLWTPSPLCWVPSESLSGLHPNVASSMKSTSV